MSVAIPPNAPAAWLSAVGGWTVGDLYEGERRMLAMQTPEGDDAAVLFVGRDKNSATNWTYGIPVEKLRVVTHVVLFVEDADYGMLVIPADVLRKLQGRSGVSHEDGRWRVGVDWFPESNGGRPTLAPIGARHLKEDVWGYFVAGPPTSLSDWYRSRP